ncbi:MAG: hypothetical protein GY679_01530 [Mycoplasma sp.]|nr:hypothetical protein [Mycoplasma sp.]
MNEDFLTVGDLKNILKDYNDSLPLAIECEEETAHSYSIKKKEIEIVKCLFFGDNKNSDYYHECFSDKCDDNCKKCVENNKYLRLALLVWWLAVSQLREIRNDWQKRDRVEKGRYNSVYFLERERRAYIRNSGYWGG